MTRRIASAPVRALVCRPSGRGPFCQGGGDHFSQPGIRTERPAFERRVILPLFYAGFYLQRAYCADIMMGKSIIIEIKSIACIMLKHEAQMRTYLRLSGCHVGLLMNFNTVVLNDGLRRFSQ
jgi:GxxExxY protein